MNCDGKIAIITGAAGNGMGRSIALTLAREGATVVINYLRNQAGAEAIADHIKARGGQAITIQANVFEKEDCERLVAATLNSFGRVDICVIGPGADWNPEKLISLKPENALADITQEVGPVYHLLPLMLKDMSKRKWGRIIGLASNMAIPSPSYSYNAAKSGRIAALKLSVGEAWKMGVTVNIVAPGPVDGIPSLADAAEQCGRAEAGVQRKKVSPQDIAEGVAFLCSDAANYITGCELPYWF